MSEQGDLERYKYLKLKEKQRGGTDIYLSIGADSADAPPPERGLVGKAWDALKVPEQKSREGLKQLAEMVPSAEPNGNMARDLALNTPKIAAETLAEVAPNFVDRPSLATFGALGLLKGAGMLGGNALGAWAGKSAEAMSGLKYKTPGVLADAVKNPALQWGPGLEKAREVYDKAKGGIDAIRQAFKEIPTKIDFIKSALEAAKDGSLTSQEALEARKALDASKKSLNDVFYSSARQTFDTVAKKAFAGADAAYQAALKSEALRNIWPLNKSGSPSVVKAGIEAFKPALAPLFSPAVQGLIASGVGVAQKAINAPMVTAPIVSITDKIKELMAKRKERK